MGKVIQFPKLVRGIPSENEKARRNMLLSRLGELEQRVVHFTDDIMYMRDAVNETEIEISQILKELAVMEGFEEPNSFDGNMAETLQRWLEGDDDENR